MKKGKRRSRAILAGLLLVPGVAAAIGVGPIQVQSGLGQRLRAQVELLSVAPDELQNLTVRLAPAQAFAQAGLDRIGALSDLQFTVEALPGGRSAIRISSQRPVREPALNFLVELGSPRGKLTREFAILLDPVRPGDRRFSEPPSAPVLTAGAAGPAGAVPATGGEYGPVRSGETLWNIADRLRPAGMPNREAVRRLFEANPDAFTRHSPNGLRAGAVLRMPADGAGWQGAQAGVAQQPPAPVAPPPAVTRPPAPPVPAPAVPSDAGAQVRLLPPDGQSGGSTALPAPMPEAPRGPDPVAGGGYGQIALDNGHLRLQAAGLDHLQSRIDSLPPAERVPEPAATAPKPVTAPATATPPAPGGAQPRPTAATPPERPQPPKPDFLDGMLLSLEDPLVLAGLGLAVAALLGGGLLAVRRARGARELERAEYESITLAADADGAALPTAVSKVPGAGGTAAGSDPLERSSLLMSLGNHAEARAVLEATLVEAPDNTAVRMRLLDVLYTLRDAESFRREVGPLRQLVYGETDPMWLRVARMGRELCPDDPLFVGSAPAPAPAPAPMAVPTAKAPTAAAAAPPERVDVDEVWRDLDFKPMDMPAPVPPAAPAMPLPPAVPTLRVPAAEAPAPAVVPAAEPALAFERVEVRRPADVAGARSVAPPAADDLLADLGWSDAELSSPGLDVPSARPTAPAPVAASPSSAAPPSSPVRTGGDLDFGGDLAAFLPPRAQEPARTPPAPAAVPTPSAAEVEDDIGFSFQPVTAPAAPAASAAAAASATPADTRSEDEFVETKLDLALAYIDMDDPLGAKGLLEEVLQEGGTNQRARAQALLERLAS